MGEDYEGQLVEVLNVSKVDTASAWPDLGEDADVFITDTSDSLHLHIDKDTDIPGSTEPSWPQDIIGICTQNDGSVPYDSDYQLMPRSISDFSITIVGIKEGGGMPPVHSLAQNFPNPFNPVTTIRYALSRICHVRLDIYNVLGQRVVTLVDERQEAGYKTVNWNGKNKSGKTVASGVYFYRLVAGDFVRTKKMVLLR